VELYIEVSGQGQNRQFDFKSSSLKEASGRPQSGIQRTGNRAEVKRLRATKALEYAAPVWDTAGDAQGVAENSARFADVGYGLDCCFNRATADG
jgi:hypothetical protein